MEGEECNVKLEASLRLGIWFQAANPPKHSHVGKGRSNQRDWGRKKGSAGGLAGFNLLGEEIDTRRGGVWCDFDGFEWCLGFGVWVVEDKATPGDLDNVRDFLLHFMRRHAPLSASFITRIGLGPFNWQKRQRLPPSRKRVGNSPISSQYRKDPTPS
ncbi:hypothetical protein LWI28_008534 [Acer negundo]|uniref:Uncharacterized protein n=1 Tax=Acer negundo TaxID=4023 RepID=A0AAD5J9U0_ACENE|nr:hypothetical protein LWI28_008534 [Acer negundo]